MTSHARNSFQYRSLPRPAKSSAMTLMSRPPSRPLSSTMDASLLALKPVPTSPVPGMGSVGRGGTKGRSGSSGGGGGGPVNQTDREKEKERAKAKADLLESAVLKAELQAESAGDALTKVQGMRRTSASKYPELSSPTTQR